MGDQSQRFILCILLLLLPIPSAVFAQDAQWIRDVKARASMENRTQDQARDYARQQARAEAVKQAVGVTIFSQFFRQQSELMRNGKIEEANDSAIKFILESAGARVLKDTVTSEYPDNIAHAGMTPKYDYVVTIDALVVKEKGSPDPDFALTLGGVEENYKHGEKLRLEMIVTKDCYVHVFSLGADGLVYHVFPNQNEPENTLRAGKTRTIPGSAVYSLPVELLADKTVASETLLVVATKDSTTFQLGEVFRPEVGYVELRRVALEHLMEWLLQIPRDRKVEAAESYVVRREK